MSRCTCGYKLSRLGCPVCHGRQPGSMEPIGSIIPRAMRSFFVVPDHFISRRHYHAWCAGIPIRNEEGRRGIRRSVDEQVRRHCRHRCQWPGCDSTTLLEVEHIVPVAFGGSNHPGNLSLLCSKHQKDSWQRFQQLLSPNASPSAA